MVDVGWSFDDEYDEHSFFEKAAMSLNASFASPVCLVACLADC